MFYSFFIVSTQKSLRTTNRNSRTILSQFWLTVHLSIRKYLSSVDLVRIWSFDLEASLLEDCDTYLYALH